MMPKNRLKRREFLDLEDNFHTQKRYLSEKLAAEISSISLNPSSDEAEEKGFESFNPYVKKKKVLRQRSAHKSSSHSGFTHKSKDPLQKTDLDEALFNLNLNLERPSEQLVNPFDPRSLPYQGLYSSEAKSKHRRAKKVESNLFEFDAAAFLERVFNPSTETPLFSSPIPNFFKSQRLLSTSLDFPLPTENHDFSKALVIYKAPPMDFRLQQLLDGKQERLVIPLEKDVEQQSVDACEEVTDMSISMIETPA